MAILARRLQVIRERITPFEHRQIILIQKVGELLDDVAGSLANIRDLSQAWDARGRFACKAPQAEVSFRICIQLGGARHLRQHEQPGSKHLDVDADTPQLVPDTVDPDRKLAQRIGRGLLHPSAGPPPTAWLRALPDLP